MSKTSRPPWVVVVQVKQTNHVTGVVGPFATRELALRWVDDNGVLFGPGANDYCTAELMPRGK